MSTQISVQEHGLRSASARVALACVALVGFAAVLFATPYGAGVSPDSIAYINAARNVIQGQGLTLDYSQAGATPLTHFPPLYPIVLAAGAWIRLEPFIAARWLNAILFALGIFLLGELLQRWTRSGLWTPLVGALLMLAAPPLLTISLMAWTEPLFLFFSFTGLWFLARYFEQQRRHWLIISATLMAAAALTRYAGIAVMLTGCAALLLLGHKPLTRRIADTFLFGLIGVLPLALWMARNLALAGTSTNRELSMHLIGRGHIMQVLDTVSGWLAIPATAPGMLKLGIALALPCLTIAAFFLGSGGQGQNERSGSVVATYFFTRLLALFVAIYGLFLLLSISFVDANTPLDDRILSPVYLAGLILILFVVDGILARSGYARPVAAAFALVGLLLFGFYISRGSQLLWTSHRNGIGLASAHWQRSVVIVRVRALPDEILLYSNAPDAIYFLTGRSAYGLPREFLATTQQPNENYHSDLERVAYQLDAEHGALVYLRTLGRSSTAYEQELRELLGLSLIFQSDDGAIYRPSPEAQSSR